ncbi:similar to sensor histidine kinase/response regulator [Plenodomus lingam JN3]|uniref:Similar to sensor histidine kinase/response regulator n=2 Tax=Leptosphaeria maculans TaxID=5022 RepID=E5AA18_LEPMJ|nr:similar to sensor histidine kinase/response regulator [Plenodomus lingam JN3]CBY00509.1 similar to sensor histidine kinase/response regulator [Plenodomus lingam JN3]
MADSLDVARSYAVARRRHKMEQTDSAKIREQQFYLYYPQHSKSEDLLSRHPSPSPVLHAATPPGTPPQTQTTADYVPRPSEDKALTAFAQLGALRLNARRCLISFFDRKDCFLLAEGTKTLSLDTGEAEFAEDRLCFGSVVFPKEQSLCYYTVNLAPKFTNLPLDDPSDLPSLVVNDLARDDRFKDLPFVKGPPKSRFYAGVPIRSPSGHSIGTYCVLDDQPRDGLTPHQLAFLKSMAGTVMRHLEMTRATEDQRRGKIMVKSLGSFAEGKSGLENWWQDPWDLAEQSVTAVIPDTINLPMRQQPFALSTAALEPIVLDKIQSAGSSVPSTKNSTVTSPASVQPPSTATPCSITLPENPRPLVPTTTSSTSANMPTDNIAPEVRATFTRAANMIVDATEAEGVSFFDAKISTFGGLVDDDFDPDILPEPDKPCVLLGSAISKTARESDSQSANDVAMSESVLKHLLRLYPHGHIFNLDDDMAMSAFNSPSAGGGDLELSDGFPFTTAQKSESMRSMDDEAYLRTVFPKARSLVLYPLWDPHRDRWFASAVIWSSDPKRVFTSEQELSYLAAFSNSVMAEVARLDTKLADAAKADFISSISHELRSPLHGILGMTDLLKDSYIDNQQVSHVATIETCGKTLLETINHVLDFAKINNLTRGASKRQKKRTQNARHMISPGQPHTNDIMTLINDVDMGILTEDVVESVFAGYTYAKTSAQTYELSTPTSNKPKLSVVLDINYSGNYVFRTQPGAWRRVIMNLFGNSLKYTPSGFVKVKLEVKRKPGALEDRCEFRFSVTDSGIGMSEDYINNRLFHSFAQENPLSQGTGLGLSIVKQIVESLGGEVEVRSEKGRGTKFMVKCPLKESSMSPSFCPTGSEQDKKRQLQAIAKRTKGLKVAFRGFNTEEDQYVEGLKTKSASKLSLKALDSLCTDWFGMFKCEEGDKATKPDLIIATEACAKILRSHQNQKPKDASEAPPVIVVCPGAAAAQSTTAITVPGIVFECISQPVGPHKLAKALGSCLDRHTDRQDELKSGTGPPAPKIVELDLKENADRHRTDQFTYLRDGSRPNLSSINSAPEIRSVGHCPVKKSIYSAPTRALNCLCVDDNPINLRLLRTFVDKLGHRHVLAINGLKALEHYKAAHEPPLSEDESNRVDVILMDINMPEMDGLEATRQIRAHEIRNNLPKVTIIALTGVADTDIQQEANSSGVNLFLIKPVRLGDLEVILKGVVTGQDKADLEFEQEKEKQKALNAARLRATSDGNEKSRLVSVGVRAISENDPVQKTVRNQEIKRLSMG